MNSFYSEFVKLTNRALKYIKSEVDKTGEVFLSNCKTTEQLNEIIYDFSQKKEPIHFLDGSVGPIILKIIKRDKEYYAIDNDKREILLKDFFEDDENKVELLRMADFIIKPAKYKILKPRSLYW